MNVNLKRVVRATVPSRYKRFIHKNIIKLKLLHSGLRYIHILGHVEIDGWLSIREAAELYDITRSVSNDYPVIVEIGSWLGKSTLILAKAIKGKKKTKLYVIEPFNIEQDESIKAVYYRYAKAHGLLDKPQKQQFIENMKRNGVLDIIEILEGYSYNFRKDFFEKIDLLYIDGNHDFPAVLKDFVDWSPLVKPGRLIVFHDVVNKQGVDGPWRVVQENIVDNPEWQDCKFVESLFHARKAP